MIQSRWGLGRSTDTHTKNGAFKGKTQKKDYFGPVGIRKKVRDGANDRCRKRRCRFIYQRCKVPFALVWPAEWIQWIMLGVSGNVQWLSIVSNGHGRELNGQTLPEGFFVLGMYVSNCGLSVCLSSRLTALDIHNEVARTTEPSAKSNQVFGARLDRTPPFRPRRFLVGRHLILQGPPTEIFLVAATNAPVNPAKSIAGYMDGTVTSWTRH